MICLMRTLSVASVFLYEKYLLSLLGNRRHKREAPKVSRGEPPSNPQPQ